MARKNVDGKMITVCDGCDQPFTKENTSPEAPTGHVSPDSPEYIDVQIAGVPGKENIARNVCINCYREDFKKVYPSEVCPI